VTLTTWLRNQAATINPTIRRARLAYLSTGNKAIEVVAEMDTLAWDDPTDRARLMSDLAAYEQMMSDLVLFCRWNRDEDAAQAGVHRTTAQLLRLLADTETADTSTDRTRGPAQWEQAFGAYLDDLADDSQADPAARAATMTYLYIASHPVIGADAAEAITCLRDAYTRLALTHTPDPATAA
jgi:hypothetical protein